MIRIEKKYTIRYSKAGYYQYDIFYEDRNGNITNKSFHPSYVNINDVPSLEHTDTIDEILKIIKDFYDNKAEIYLINDMPPFYYNNTELKTRIKEHINIVDKIINKQCQEFFLEDIAPILIQNKWMVTRSHMGIPIIVCEDKNGEYDNIRNGKDQELEYICYSFMSGLGLYRDKVNMCQEHSKPSINGFRYLIKYVSQETLIEKGLHLEL